MGDKMPEGAFGTMTDNGPGLITTEEVFKDKEVVLFSVPGAFTGTCHLKHMPSFVTGGHLLYEAGIDTIACIAVNDLFVLDAWAKAQSKDHSILMLADGNADYVSRLGLESDERKWGMGFRGQRFSMLISNGVIQALNIDDAGEFEKTSCDFMLEQINTHRHR
tara:strand:- start:145 stop:633 length:489 start_codon:yes stop_codon:yes gene_type:complete